MKRTTVVFYFITLPLLSIFFVGYSFIFPESESVLEFLNIYRMADPSYLARDWYLNTAMAYGLSYRTIYDVILYEGAKWSSLEWSTFLYYCAGLLLLPWMGYLIACRALQADRPAGLVAGLLLLSVHNGSVSTTPLYPTAFGEPIVTALAAPLSLFVVFLFLRNQTILGLAAGGILSLLHPLVGVFVSLCSFGALIVSRWQAHELSRRHLLTFLGLLGLLFFWRQQPLGAGISAERYMEILATRSPHHYLPTAFAFKEWVSFVFLQILFWLAVFKGRAVLGRKEFVFVQSFGALILLGCVAGFVFVEIFPIKFVFVAQLFRYLYLQNSMALILIGILLTPGLARLVQTKTTYLVLLMTALLTLLLATTFWSSAGFLWLVALALAVELYRHAALKKLSRSAIATLLLLGFFSQSEWSGLTISKVWDEKLIFNWSAERARASNESTPPEINAAEIYRLADFAKANTPADAIFLTPPTYVTFRIAAERAIVVDGKAFPYRDPAGWLERMTMVYGLQIKEIQKNYWHRLALLNDRYASISTTEIDAAKIRYGASHAVLARDAQVPYPTLFEGKQYKIVDLR